MCTTGSHILFDIVATIHVTIRVLPRFLFYSFHKKIIQPPAIFSATHSRAEPDLDKENDEFLRQYITVGSGILMGMGGVYCREPPMPPLTIVVRNVYIRASNKGLHLLINVFFLN